MKKQSRWLTFALGTLALATMTACAPLNEGAGAATAMVDPAHNSRNSLDWAGTYAGALPCADCPGVQARLRLNRDGTYELSIQYLERDKAPSQVRGRFTWQANGNAITLGAQGGGRQVLVGEGRGALFDAGAMAAWPQATQRQLTRLKPLAATELPRTFEAHRWTLDAGRWSGLLTRRASLSPAFRPRPPGRLTSISAPAASISKAVATAC